ncbi:MAG: type I-C CRISPR-associated protein Cas7/Csd2 [Acidobacteria bacterium]|nr:type I-C CRISPR-associated protein Cas7/Csd2 [Acidobacteriota bacterium]
MSTSGVIEKRYDFVLLFDVAHGNPNGDPDAGNSPRIDPETGHGIVTDVCLKRKIRNFVAQTRGCQPPYEIYVKERGILAKEQKRAYEAVQAEPGDRPNEQAREWMCKNFFDVRTFGAVMTTGKTEEETAGEERRGRGARKIQKLWNCGQVRGPVQLGFARSITPVLTLEHTITRVALTNPGDTERASEEEGDEKAATGQMGRKYTIPYGLYRVHGFVSPFLAQNTGFGQADLEILLEALTHMFEHDRSAARGEMAVRGLYVFEHESALGNAPAHRLFELIQVEGPERPRSFPEHRVKLPPETGTVPAGVTLKRIV